MEFNKDTLKHLTMLVIGVGATYLASIGILSSEGVGIIYAFLAGYAFKNGYVIPKANGKLSK